MQKVNVENQGLAKLRKSWIKSFKSSQKVENSFKMLKNRSMKKLGEFQFFQFLVQSFLFTETSSINCLFQDVYFDYSLPTNVRWMAVLHLKNFLDSSKHPTFWQSSSERWIFQTYSKIITNKLIYTPIKFLSDPWHLKRSSSFVSVWWRILLNLSIN